MIEILENVPMPEFLQIDIGGLKDGNYFKIPITDIKRSNGLIDRLRSMAKPYGIEFVILRGEEYAEFWVKKIPDSQNLWPNLIGVLSEKSKFMSIKEMVEITKMPYLVVRKTLLDLVEAGTIIRINHKNEGRGRPLSLYRLA